jgi:hypothetical protein
VRHQYDWFRSFFDGHSGVWHQVGALIRLLGKLNELGQATSQVPGAAQGSPQRLDSFGASFSRRGLHLNDDEAPS